jgi:hypothetical protein
VHLLPSCHQVTAGSAWAYQQLASILTALEQQQQHLLLLLLLLLCSPRLNHLLVMAGSPSTCLCKGPRQHRPQQQQQML